MVLTTGWRCLRTSALRSALTTPVAVASFSTTPAFAAEPKKAKAGAKKGAPPNKMQRQNVSRGPAKVESKKGVYKIGERKEIRNRIVLSNTNAPLLTLPPFTVETSLHEPAVSSVFAFTDTDIDRLRAIGGFQRSQDWKYFNRPSTVLRHETLVLSEMMERVQGGEDAPQGAFARLIVTGPKGSGKSVYMLQAMALAIQRNWVVINIPKGTPARAPSRPAPHP